jgi:superfamily II DNA/RNA helicase
VRTPTKAVGCCGSQLSHHHPPPLSASARSRDILGAARTGSGKTLAFVVPLLERLFRERWAAGDGLGALVISPTRELALQVRGR